MSTIQLWQNSGQYIAVHWIWTCNSKSMTVQWTDSHLRCVSSTLLPVNFVQSPSTSKGIFGCSQVSFVFLLANLNTTLVIPIVATCILNDLVSWWSTQYDQYTELPVFSPNRFQGMREGMIWVESVATSSLWMLPIPTSKESLLKYAGENTCSFYPCIGHKTWPVGGIDLLCLTVIKFSHRVLWDEVSGLSIIREVKVSKCGEERRLGIAKWLKCINNNIEMSSHWYTSTVHFESTTTFVTYMYFISCLV